LTVDYLARQQADRGFSPLIVRFNGGAQAGHTVVHGSVSHVFNHVGAGSFVAGARTYLGSPFIVNPYTLEKELRFLADKGVRPTIYAHPNCKVTTVYDMALNSLAELSRGISRHGSCGMGINETVTRNEDQLAALKLGAVKAMPMQALAQQLKYISETYVPKRLEQLGITDTDLAQHDVFSRIFKLRNYEEQAQQLKTLIEPLIILDKASLGELQLTIQPGQEIIMEGAQGLALDEHLGAFPYVTRSINGPAPSCTTPQTSRTCGKALSARRRWTCNA
jgi:adenylosuccinate synthase